MTMKKGYREATFSKGKAVLDADLQTAVLERGLSFIQAAQLILDNTEKKFPKENAYLDALEKVWQEENRKDLTQQNLAKLEKSLIDFINLTLYNHQKAFKKVKDELDNAENHVNWKQRKHFLTNIPECSMIRADVPIVAFSKTQQEEWLRTLDDKASHILGDKPSWFLALPEWEQNHLKGRIKDWQANHREENLGTFLGSVPTTIRRYPGAPNAYKTEVKIGDQSFHKIRSGVLIPVKLRANSSRKKQEKVEITRQNIEQLMLAAIQDKLGRMPDEDKKKPITLPILLQTLYSPPFQPPGPYNNTALKKAIQMLRKELADPKAFLEKHGIKTPVTFQKIELLYSNSPVNKARGLSWISNALSWQGQESHHAMAKLEKYLKQQIKANAGQVLPNDLKVAQDALKSLKKIKLTGNTLGALRKTKHNAMAEKAALEQIVADKLGIRIGSCVSGKDREEMITEIAIAQMIHYQKHGHFPPPYAQNKNKSGERQEFIGNVAKQFLSGHGQKLAGENAKGCEGLKNITDVFGKDICMKITQIAPQYGIDPKVFDPVVDVQRMAGLNKLSVKKLNVDSQSLVDKVLKRLGAKLKGKALTPNLENLRQRSDVFSHKKPKAQVEPSRKSSKKLK